MVRYVHLPGAAVDTALLEDATRRGMFLPPSSHPHQISSIRRRKMVRADRARVTEAAAQASKAR